ncbi:MAG: nucleoside triphosphate pyrophosphohydrolase, partial [Nitrospiraceae bacterium]|nr:nucleoside triphosphate pyrophosphohydrolase [Nitrospiraceae bacterium]
MSAGEEFEKLLKIMDALREGCPWDRKQTPESLKPYIIEEAYEVLEAVEEKDPAKIKEELGDLLFQIIFQARIAQEKREFDIAGVLRAISEKMVSRHPHVFGEAEAKTAEDVIEKWQEHKRREGKLRESVLEGIPVDLPALLRAQKVQKRASRAGFDWQRAEDVLEKLEEEVGEFRDAVKSENRDEMEEELGDILFSIVNTARLMGLNPEEALRKTTSKFAGRFRYIEK